MHTHLKSLVNRFPVQGLHTFELPISDPFLRGKYLNDGFLSRESVMRNGFPSHDFIMATICS